MIFTPTTLFHMHTYHCGHASSEPDIAYIEKAIALGAERIVFTDHFREIISLGVWTMR